MEHRSKSSLRVLLPFSPSPVLMQVLSSTHTHTRARGFGSFIRCRLPTYVALVAHIFCAENN